MSQRRYKVFFAIPYDGATRPMYDWMKGALENDYRNQFDLWIGDNPPLTEPPLLELETFKAQNSDLFTKFRFHIRSSDIIIADLSYNNPNVHVELGIAIELNKNILRVSGRDLTELSFDVRNHDVFRYAEAKGLYDKIRHYFDLFLKIKSSPIGDTASPFYMRHPPLSLDHMQGHSGDPEK